jgi:hypothetical protein
VVFAACGVEWRVTDFLSANLQIEAMNNPYPRTGNYRLDHHPFQVTVGMCAAPWDCMRWTLTFSEDLSRTAPDFAVSLTAQILL